MIWKSPRSPSMEQYLLCTQRPLQPRAAREARPPQTGTTDMCSRTHEHLLCAESKAPDIGRRIKQTRSLPFSHLQCDRLVGWGVVPQTIKGNRTESRKSWVSGEGPQAGEERQERTSTM